MVPSPNPVVWGVSRRQTTLFLLGAVGLSVVGAGSLRVEVWGPIAQIFAVLVLLTATTAYQAWSNGSLLSGVVLSVSPSIGALVVLGSGSGWQPTDGFYVFPLALGLTFGLLGHAIGTEIGIWRGTGAREPGLLERLAVSLAALGGALYLYPGLP